MQSLSKGLDEEKFDRLGKYFLNLTPPPPQGFFNGKLQWVFVHALICNILLGVPVPHLIMKGNPHSPTSCAVNHAIILPTSKAPTGSTPKNHPHNNKKHTSQDHHSQQWTSSLRLATHQTHPPLITSSLRYQIYTYHKKIDLHH